MDSASTLFQDFQRLEISSRDDELREIFDAVVKIYRCQLSAAGYGPVEVRKQIMKMSHVYTKELGHKTPRVNFSDPCSQWTYMYMYLLRHFDLVFHAFSILLAEKKVEVGPNHGERNMCVIGGGPGTDILGYIMFLRRHGCPIAGKINVLDKYPSWNLSWNNLHLYLPEKYRPAIPPVQYHEFDYLCNTLPQDLQKIVGSADIVTMTKSLSSAAAWLQDAEPKYLDAEDGQTEIFEWHSVYDIMKNMKTGALLLYIDTPTGPQRNILRGAEKCLDLKVLHSGKLETSVTSHIFSSSATNLIQELEHHPLLQAGENEVFLLQKTVI